MIQTESKIIGGDRYEVSQLGALKGRQVLVRLAKLGALFGKVRGADAESKVFEALETLDGELFEYLCNTFAVTTRVYQDGGAKGPLLSDVFDLHFAGKYLEMVKWLGFALQVNYGSFLAGLSGLADSLPGAA